MRLCFLFAAALLLACGPSSSSGGADEPASFDSVDRIEGLPAPTRPLVGTTERFQELWTAAQLALDEPLPPPDVLDEEVYIEWVDRRLARWLRQRAEAIARVKERLRGLGAAPGDEQVMGAAALGFLMEETAREVLDAPVPERAGRPARAAALRDALADEVGPLRAAARNAYDVCAERAEGAAPHLHVWREHCEARARALEDD